MEPTLQFIVMVDSELGESQLLDAVLSRFPDARRLKAHSCEVAGNWMEIWGNEDADPEATSGEDGYLFYSWRVELTPLGAADEDHQIRLARDLKACFTDLGATAEVCAAFEDRV